MSHDILILTPPFGTRNGAFLDKKLSPLVCNMPRPDILSSDDLDQTLCHLKQKIDIDFALLQLCRLQSYYTFLMSKTNEQNGTSNCVVNSLTQDILYKQNITLHFKMDPIILQKLKKIKETHTNTPTPLY